MIQQLTPALPVADQLADVRRLYGQGLYLQALAKAEAMGPLRTWAGAAERIMAGRLAGVLGGGRLSRVLHLAAYREHPADPWACYYGLRAIVSRRGPWHARRAWQRIGAQPGAPNILRADWLAFFGLISATLRDFEVADQFVTQALELAPDRPWIHVERSAILQIEDRFDEALAAAEESLAIRPWFRPGVQAAAHYLCCLNRDREALDLLLAAAERLECGNVVAQLATLQDELGMESEARQSLARLRELYPLQDKAVARWMASVECDLASKSGDIPAAIDAGRRAGPGYFEKVVQNLVTAQPGDKRLVLPVDFVQQHHVTCAPATLTALSKFWGREADHLEIADMICYDGTPHHRQRSWAVESGFAVHEFTIDWDTTVALIDRGVPFTMVTVEPPTSHLIAVIGYDARRRTLVLRDPSLRYRTEMLAKQGLENLRSTGPLGMVMVPRENAHLLDGLALPDAKLYDDLYELQMALERHDRQQAATNHERMVVRGPEHRLTLNARRALAAYDADPIAARNAGELLLRQFPDDTMLLLARVDSLRPDATRQDRIDSLMDIVDGPRSHPLFRLQLAEEWSQDAQCHSEARRLLRRLFIQRPYEARVFHAQATVEWGAGNFVEATELYRCAACLNNKDDRFARDWFLAARHVKQGEQALAYLRDRFERYGHQSSRPAIMLAHAYNDLSRGHEELQMLEEAIRRRPNDGDLLVFAADSYSRRGDFARARGLLAEAEGCSRRGGWLRSTAALANAEGELERARRRWEEVLELEPQAVDAHEGFCALLAATAGEGAALEHLRKTIARFPNNLALIRLAVSRLGTEHPDEAEAMIRRLLDANPVDPWARRELASLLGRQGRWSEALVEAETAIVLAPGDTVSYAMRGWIRERSGDIPAAMADYRLAIEHSADNDEAIDRLIYCAATHADRVAALEFIHEQLKRQTTFGSGLFAYRNHAHGALKPDDVLTHLRDALAARPDLWQAWSAVIRQLTDMECRSEATTLAITASERFPLIPAAWSDLATVRRARGEAEAEIAALEKAIEINPNWDVTIRALADALDRSGQMDRARSLLEDAVARLPLDGGLRGCWADMLWHSGDRQRGLDALEQAVRNLPDYDWAWDALEDRSRQMGCAVRAERAARELVGRRPGDARCWVRLARTLRSPEAHAERMTALDRTIGLNPRTISAHLLRAQTLCDAKQFSEARQACAPPCYADQLPADLRLAAARVTVAEGELGDAITETCAIVAENPDFYNGYRQLCEWCIEAPGRQAELLDAAKHLVELRPNDALGWRFLAEASLAQNNRKEAKNYFRRAIELHPPWAYPRWRLFDLCLEDREYDTAGKALERLLNTERDAFTLARQVQLLVKRWDRNSAVAILEELCACELPTDWPLAAAADAFLAQGCGDRARIVLRVAMDRPGANQQVFNQWARIEVRQKQWRRAAKELKKHSSNDAGWAAAARRLLEGMAQSQQKSAVVRFIRGNTERLCRDLISWGTAGYALVTVGKPRAALGWLADWKTREGVQPWILTNVAVSFARLHRDDEAAAVHRHALTLPPDNSTHVHRIYLAAAEAADGRFDAAKTLVDQTAGQQLADIPLCVRRLVVEVLRLQADTVLARGLCPSFAANRRLRATVRPFNKFWLTSPFLRRIYLRLARGLARDRGWWLLRILSFQIR